MFHETVYRNDSILIHFFTNAAGEDDKQTFIEQIKSNGVEKLEFRKSKPIDIGYTQCIVCVCYRK